jgi:transcriptional regulator with XRE-family HTH domain
MGNSKKGKPNEKLRMARKKQGWSQEELARRVDTTSLSVIRWEKGATFPSPHFRRRLAEVFGGVSLEELGLIEDTTASQELITDLVLPALAASPVSLLPSETPQESGESETDLEEQKEDASTPPSEPNRQRMLKRVRFIWIKGLLEDSLHGAALITLGLHEQPDALANPWRLTVQELDHAPRPLPPGTRITQVYDDADGELLILGEPGVGKTTLLLELARDLLDRAERDIMHPMPVVFNLSSWAQKRQLLTSWLVEELHSKYQVPRNVGQMWVDTDQVLPLLDGLDEVALACREECLRAINVYRQAHQHVPVIVCSRRAEYMVQATRIALHCAVVVQSLTRQQIDDYLLSAGGRLEAVRVALSTDPGLQEMVQTPLMLSIFMLAYSGESIQGLLAEHSPEARRQQVFATYVERMLKRRGRVTRYTPWQPVRRLSFLARQLVKHNQTVFYVERLQPDWLILSPFRFCYRILVPLVIGLIYGLIFELIGGPVFGLVGALYVGLVFGLVRKIEPAEVISWSWARLWQNRDYGLVYGLVSGLASGLLCGLVHGPIGGPMSEQLYSGVGGKEISRLAGGLGAGLVGGMIFGQARRVRLPRVISWQWGSRQQNLAYGLICGLVSGAASGLISGLVFEKSSDLSHGLVGGVVGGLVGGLVVILIGGLSHDVLDEHEHTTPNEGIWRSVQRSIRSALVLGLVGVIINAVHGLSGALVVGLVFAMIGGLFFGGATCIQHFVLRGFLWLSGSIPPDYVGFLDYAVERILLRRVGGGYIFIHRLLLDYFVATRELDV